MLLDQPLMKGAASRSYSLHVVREGLDVLPPVLVLSPDAEIRRPPRSLAAQEALHDSEHLSVEQGLAKAQFDVQTILFRSLLRHNGMGDKITLPALISFTHASGHGPMNPLSGAFGLLARKKSWFVNCARATTM